jgi:NADH-quinone oxidoreductase subunit H
MGGLMSTLHLVYTLVNIVAVFAVVQGACALLIYVERKVAAYVQDRYGPNRVGPVGLFQSVADGLKFLFKEDVIPSHVDRKLFLIAPCVSLITAMLALAVVPFGATEPAPRMPMELARPLSATATDAQKAKRAEVEARFGKEVKDYRDTYQAVIAPGVDIGILYIFALGSLAVYGIILGGWSANNKYSLLGGLRSSAQIISYEIPLGLSILGIVLMSGSLNLERITWQQASGDWPVWNVAYQPLAFLLFMVSAFAETNRLPFDLPEAEQELIGGFHTEYSAMKFALFFLGEYANVITTSFLMVILFFGGWHLPFVATTTMLGFIGFVTKLAVIVVKVTLVILFIMMIRWTLPRFRFDQLMGLAWKVLIPLALINLVLVMAVLELKRVTGAGGLEWLLLPASLAVMVGAALLTTRTGTPSLEDRQRAELERERAAVS